LNLDLESNLIKEGSATIEYQANRACHSGDNTTLDAIFTIKKEWIWGIEAKYFDLLRKDQINREIRAVESLQKFLGYTKAGMIFILPEQQIGTIVKRDETTRKAIADYIVNSKVSISITSWEIVFDILKDSGVRQLKK